MRHLLVLLSLVSLNASASMQKAYDQGKGMNLGVSLLSPAEYISVPAYSGTDIKVNKSTMAADAKGQIKSGHNIESLLVTSDLNAQDVFQGEDEFAGEKFMKVDAQVSNNPMKHLKGKVTQRSERKSLAYTKTCEEGTNFEIKTRLSLRYQPPPRETLDTTLTLYYPDYIKKVGIKNDEIAPLPMTTTNYQVNIERFRKHACPHFVPVDYVTGKRYKIDCKRIKNFSLSAVLDKTHVPVTDVTGASFTAARLIRLTYQHDTYQSDAGGKEGWQFKSPDFQEVILKHNCTLVKERCLDKEPRTFEELKVERPCWEKELTYQCTSSTLNTCQDIKKKGCSLSKSECLEKYQGIQSQGIQSQGLCLKYRKTYTCKRNTTVQISTTEGKDLPFCLGGDCHMPEMGEDPDFGEAISKLAALHAMQHDKTKVDPLHVFKGDSVACNRHLASFKDCCQSGKGWGPKLKIAKCEAEELSLAERRANGQCHYVGQFCAEKIPLIGTCLRQKSVFCCFGSKLSRLFHEQGRPQIGKGWGTPKYPRCEAFTVEELKNIDFTKVDLSELFEGLFAEAKTKTKLTASFIGKINPNKNPAGQKIGADITRTHNQDGETF